MIEIENALEELKHCKEIGNIIFQVPEDNEVIDTIIQALEKQMPKAIKFNDNDLNMCPVCKGHIGTEE